jgi:hypothetical protein
VLILRHEAALQVTRNLSGDPAEVTDRLADLARDLRQLARPEDDER